MAVTAASTPAIKISFFIMVICYERYEQVHKRRGLTACQLFY